ncbi:MAG: PTS fructose transporter subunit IIA [Betaproteobacteria bacterium HGW-Betaproteobacteria-22]|nr:MAG: PTS fructose transporter subunit IIA [Betaproteobacteria bacterium HGW-Betaproteobacteria-22]
MIGILIVTHGALGASLIACATHFFGSAPEQVMTLSVGSQDAPRDLISDALRMIAALDTGSGVLVLSDMYGATPSNLVAELLQPGQVEAVAGLNLPMLVRALTYRERSLAEVVDKALSGGREGVVSFNSEHCERYM